MPTTTTVSDWSAEVEEEEERIQHEQQKRSNRERGIIRLPQPAAESLREPAPSQQPQLHPSSSDVNPAWRGTHPWQQQPQPQAHPDSRRPLQDHRVLFDPKHPEKPLPGRMVGQQVTFYFIIRLIIRFIN